MDFVIKGATVIDGTGRAPFLADVYVSGDRVAYVGNDIYSTTTQIDARGFVLAPGFMDLHTHSDVSPYCAPGFESALTQGVTFHLAGNCGSSLVPHRKEAHDASGTSMSRQKFPKMLTGTGYGAHNVAEYLQEVRSISPSINFGTLTGHGTLRSYIMENPSSAEPTEEELQKMEGLLREQLRAGSFGMSLGLVYMPGRYAKSEELIRLARVVAEEDALVTVHMRSEADGVFDAVNEIRHIARESGARFHISHFKLMYARQWGKADRLLNVLDEMKAEGIRVSCDQYPYCSSSTGFISLLPLWAKSEGNLQTLANLRDDNTFAKMLPEISAALERRGGPDCHVAAYTCGGMPECDGMTLSEAAEFMGVSPEEAYRRILIASRCNASGIYHAMAEEDVIKIASRMDIAVASDGFGYDILSIGAMGKPHPRSAGTFARFLRMAREKKLMPIEKAIYKMTGLPATILQMKDRGIICPGAYADLVLFDADRISDRATFTAPDRPAVGIEKVFVNGKQVLEDGKPIVRGCGMVLARQRLQ